MTKIAIIGAAGRMGRMLIQSTLNNPNATLVGAFVRPTSNLIRADAGEFVGAGNCSVPLSASADFDGECDVLIDFSLPEALDETLAFCHKHKTALVMGVTGLTQTQEQKLQQASQSTAIVYAGNYSTGVNLSLNLLATTAKVLGLDADVEIVEKHHKHKLDAPSGTALMMAKAVAHAREQTLSEVAVNGRDGIAKRKAGEIGIHAVRGGEIIGEHTVSFIMGNELIEITHKAQSRVAFADGAVRAGIWLQGKDKGMFDMTDVLGLN